MRVELFVQKGSSFPSPQSPIPNPYISAPGEEERALRQIFDDEGGDLGVAGVAGPVAYDDDDHAVAFAPGRGSKIVTGCADITGLDSIDPVDQAEQLVCAVVGAA